MVQICLRTNQGLVEMKIHHSIEKGLETCLEPAMTDGAEGVKRQRAGPKTTGIGEVPFGKDAEAQRSEPEPPEPQPESQPSASERSEALTMRRAQSAHLPPAAAAAPAGTTRAAPRQRHLAGLGVAYLRTPRLFN